MQKPYEYSYELRVGVTSGSLIDLETTGRNPFGDEIITFGYIEGHTLRIVQRRRKEKEQAFLNRLKPALEVLPQPFYAYSADFERDFIKAKFRIRAKFVDLMKPWKRKAERTLCLSCKGKGVVLDGICEHCQGWGRLKWPKLGELISEPGKYFGEEVIQGRDVPTLWDRYCKTKKLKYLLLIIQHCQIDLLRELILLIHFV